MYGRYDNGLTDAEPVREHLRYLQNSGLGWKRIATLSGVGKTAIESLIYGRKGSTTDPRKGEVLMRTTRTKAAAILAVKPDLALLAGGASISARGTHRRIQALVSRGWSQSKLSALVGMDPSNFWGLMRREKVSVTTHRVVAEIYDRLWNEEPPKAEWRDKIAYSRSISYAKQRRWLPPLAWDDIDTDTEPPVQDEIGGIDVMAVELAMSGERMRLSPPERREAITRLHAHRWSDQRIAEQIGVAPRTVWRIRQELGLEAFEQSELVDMRAA
jgi:transcriptional regulator with XRE-family HTH domain